MYMSSNGPYMGVGMGPIQEQQWAIYARIHTPLLAPYMAIYARMYAPLILSYMAHIYAYYCSQMWPITALKYGLLLR